jgi:hypothetical protein
MIRTREERDKNRVNRRERQKRVIINPNIGNK